MWFNWLWVHQLNEVSTPEIPVIKKKVSVN